MEIFIIIFDVEHISRTIIPITGSTFLNLFSSYSHWSEVRISESYPNTESPTFILDEKLS